MKLYYPQNSSFHSYSAEFPRQCDSCSKVYTSVENYLEETLPFYGHTNDKDKHLFESHDLSYRVCSCGKLMIISLKSRRDKTAEGITRRKYFQHLLNLLTKQEIDKRTAKSHLRRIFNKDPEIHHIKSNTE